MGDFFIHQKGDGLEFYGLRPYEPGDPLRHVHWRKLAATGKAYTKEYQMEHDKNLVLAIDISASMGFGGNELLDRAKRLTALLAYGAIHAENAVTVLAFSGHGVEWSGTGKGLSHLAKILEMLSNLKIKEGRPEEGADILVSWLKSKFNKKPLLFLISDFAWQKWPEWLGMLPHKWHPIALQLWDFKMSLWPKYGGWLSREMESGQISILRPSGNLKSKWELKVKQRHERYQRIWQKQGGRWLKIGQQDLHADTFQIGNRDASQLLEFLWGHDL